MIAQKIASYLELKCLYGVAGRQSAMLFCFLVSQG